MNNKRILILYAEVMGYVISAIEDYLEKYKDTEVLLIELDKRKLTSFTFQSELLNYRKKSSFVSYKDFKETCINFDPQLVLVSGRMDNEYLKVARYFKKKSIYTVTLQDTQFIHSLRQKIISVFSFLLYHRYFNGFWGSGNPQIAFGYRIGYSSENIYSGFYTANNKVFKQDSPRDFRNETKTFLFIGRLAKEKNILNLIESFNQVNIESQTNHKLILIGDGPLKKYILQLKNSNIELHSFKSAYDISLIAKNVHAFILPSTYEPWGLVVHECASLSLPILASHNCGSNSTFLINGYNGFNFDPYSISSMKNAISSFLKLTPEEQFDMSLYSFKLSNRISNETWSATLRSILIKSLQH
jgi:glycosyltransferase involved in cell wall biosynthesis